eukprot:Sspe_Gene.92369::Locus_64523_Transcript_1_1_Confidence_1.000_Length_558::g.92369::m.92369
MACGHTLLERSYRSVCEGLQRYCDGTAIKLCTPPPGPLLYMWYGCCGNRITERPRMVHWRCVHPSSPFLFLLILTATMIQPFLGDSFLVGALAGPGLLGADGGHP